MNLDTVDTRTLYRTFDRLRRANRRLRRPLSYGPDLDWLPYLDAYPGVMERAVALCTLGEALRAYPGVMERAVALCTLGEALRARGHRDPYCLWSAYPSTRGVR
jgi:hypothetical protein